ncbi:MAG: GIY-YIG nuclease family protein [Maricaulaceae bacterium]
MMTSGVRGTIYIGVTSQLAERDWLHHKSTSGFTARYDVKRLVWFEHHETMQSAIQREKNLKSWRRQWKIELIETHNPHLHRLCPETGAAIVDG